MSKLDFKTRLYLYVSKAVIEKHEKVVDVEDKKDYSLNVTDKNIVYVFENYQEYKKYFEMYLDNVNEEIINLAIYTRGKNGEIVALKGLCNYIIVKSRMKAFYESITEERIKDIHEKGKFTPLEAVKSWEDNNLCNLGEQNFQPISNCHFFNYNCHDCLLELASHKAEYDSMDLDSVNSKENAKQLTK